MGEFLVVQVLIQKFMNHRQIERIIGSGPDHHEPAGLGGRDVGPDIDHRQLAAAVHGIHQVVDFLDIHGLENVSELQDHMFGVFQVIHQLFSANPRQ